MGEPDERPAPTTRRGMAALGHGARSAARWGTHGSPALLWRLLVPLVFALAGFLFVTSAESARGGDLRGDSATSLSGLVQGERDSVDGLRAQRAALEQQVDELSGSVTDASLTRLEHRVSELRSVSGRGELVGPAVKVTLDDAPYDQDVPEGFTANDLVVHQQDLQAVVNALWLGGAEGISLQGQRIVGTTGIKCVGNTVLLQGVPYSPPYKIVAVGDTSGMVGAVEDSDYIDIYKQYTAPPVNIGWDIERVDEATVPPYEGNVALEYAEAVR